MIEYEAYICPISMKNKRKKSISSTAYNSTFKISQSTNTRNKSLTWKSNVTQWFSAFRMNSELVTFIVKDNKMYGRLWNLKSVAED